MMDDILPFVLSNMPDEKNVDDAVVKGFIAAAISYAESYQRLPKGTYAHQTMGEDTKRAVIQLASYFYQTRIGFPDGIKKGSAVWNELNAKLRADRNWDI
ncbi:MAG: head-tail connector protein [Defluviitaleaceae bacterium]|nr:head-tail connector protein [Defluviitaleaceae bacterium]